MFKRRAAGPLLAALAAALALLPALRNGFVDWDDRSTLLLNEHFRGLSWENLRWMLSSFHLGHWQPLAWLSFCADYALWGMRPFGYHLTALLLHSANAVLACLLGERLLAAGGTPPEHAQTAAFWGALLFAVHPLRVESVAWATERRDVLMGLFFIAAMLAHVRESRGEARANPRYALTTAMAALCALSNVRGLTLPAALLLLDVYPLRRLPVDPRTWLKPASRPVLMEKRGPALVALASALVGLAAQSADSSPLTPLSRFGPVARLAQAVYGLGFYLVKLFAPIDLSPLYERSWRLDRAEFLAYGSVALASFALAWRARRRLPALAAALGFYALTLSPTLGLVKSGRQTVADRYSYLPCLGVCLLLGHLIAASKRRWAPFAAAALAALLIAASWRQCAVWRDSVSLWTRAVEVDPRSFFARRNLAGALAQTGRVEEAAAQQAQADAVYADIVRRAGPLR